jgi:hypothetical protein
MEDPTIEAIRITGLINLLFQILIGVAIVLLCYYIILKIRKERYQWNKLKRDDKSDGS